MEPLSTSESQLESPVSQLMPSPLTLPPSLPESLVLLTDRVDVPGFGDGV